MTTIAGINRVAIIGTGTIGASWAALCLAKGLDVVAHDPMPDREDWMRRFIDRAWPDLEKLGLAEDASRRRLRYEADLEKACAGVQFLQENAPEVEATKIELFARIEQCLAPDAIIASSSSALLISRLQKGCTHPERVVLGHPFNPPHLIPLVEVVKGPLTSSATVQAAMDFYKGLGKAPILVKKEVPGHVANRIQAAVFREVLHLLSEDVASIGDLDSAMSNGPGLRWALMGPFQLYHLGGGRGGMEAFLKQFTGTFETMWKDLGAPALTEDLQRRIIQDVAQEVSGRSIEELAAERDARLIAVLANRDAT
jgi:3-hydroxyacyl-CoA dehydrogenase